MPVTGKSLYLKWLYLIYELHIQCIRVPELLLLQHKDVVTKARKVKVKDNL